MVCCHRDGDACDYEFRQLSSRKIGIVISWSRMVLFSGFLIHMGLSIASCLFGFSLLVMSKFLVSLDTPFVFKWTYPLLYKDMSIATLSNLKLKSLSTNSVDRYTLYLVVVSVKPLFLLPWTHFGSISKIKLLLFISRINNYLSASYQLVYLLLKHWRILVFQLGVADLWRISLLEKHIRSQSYILRQNYGVNRFQNSRLPVLI